MNIDLTNVHILFPILLGGEFTQFCKLCPIAMSKVQFDPQSSLC